MSIIVLLFLLWLWWVVASETTLNEWAVVDMVGGFLAFEADEL